MTKPYTVSFDKSVWAVMIRVFGAASHDDHCAVRDEAIRLSQENECSRLLVDLRELITERSSTMDCFSFGESLAKATQYRYLRIAHVLPSDAESKQDVRFTSTVEANRGKSTREFETVEEAMEWLLDQE